MTIRYQFADWQLWPASRELRHQGQVMPLGGRAFDLLLALLETGDRLASKEWLYERVWPGLAVEPNNLQVQVWTLRKLLGTKSIATVARRGYRLTLPVRVQAPVAKLPAASATTLLNGLAAQLLQHRFVNLAVRDDTALQAWLRQVRPGLLAVLDGGVWLLDALDLQRPDAPLAQLLARLTGKKVLVVLSGGQLAPDAMLRHAETALARWPGLHLVVTSPRSLRLGQALVLTLPAPCNSAAVVTQPVSSLRWHPRQSGGDPALQVV